MKRSYKDQLALPEEVTITITIEEDASVNQAAVNAYVDGLSRPGWYTHDFSNRKDTRLFMLERYQPFTPKTIDGKLTRTWVCENCEGLILYEGVQIGHKRAWKEELKAAGVLNAEEAKAAYNNLNNLRIECSTCNQSHDWE